MSLSSNSPTDTPTPLEISTQHRFVDTRNDTPHIIVITDTTPTHYKLKHQSGDRELIRKTTFTTAYQNNNFTHFIGSKL